MPNLLTASTLPDVVYHYCSVDTFFQIITNHTSYRQILKQQMGEVQEAPKKKHWWSRG